MSSLGLPPRTMPNLNTYRILSLVWKRRHISRIEASNQLGLTKSTVTKITGQLIEDGLLVERPVSKAEGRGRPRVALQLNEERGLVLGLEVRTDGWVSVLVRFDGSVARRVEGRRTWEPSRLAHDLGELLEGLAADTPGGLPVLGAGLGLPGIVNGRDGVVVSSNPLDVQEPLDLRARLEAKLGFPVVVDNDATCGCWGELAFGQAEASGPFLFVLCEERRHRTDVPGPEHIAALGFGLVLGGSPWRGPDHSAGEFSSVLKQPSDGHEFQFHLPESEMVRVFSDAASEARLVEELGRNVAMLVNFLNLKAVYLAWPAQGDGARARQVFTQLIAANWIYPSTVLCTVAAPTGGADAVAWGAAGYFLECLLGDRAFDDSQPRWK